ncbi:MAG TPA: hypothetical protein DD642_09810 [Barnesiella sp.]|nr:hypothetical protein [Barnesiella sp.]
MLNDKIHWHSNSMRMPMFIIQQIQRIQSMDETAQNAPVGIGVMNGKSRPCKAGRLQLVPVHIK